MAKSKYQEDFPERAKEYASQGMIDLEIAAELGISHDSFYRYQREHPDFAEAIKTGKAGPNQAVQNALYKRAIGYDITETHTETELTTGKDSVPNITKVKTIKKHIPGDVTAQIFWLKNRMPNQWKEPKEEGEDRPINNFIVPNQETADLMKQFIDNGGKTDDSIPEKS